jgi:group I intron endonuclease
MNHAAQAKAGHTYYIAKAIRKWGIESFEFIVLAFCDDVPSGLAKERELIAFWKPEYNTAAGGLSGPQGWKHSEESRRRMSESHIGKVGPWRGKKRPRETVEKMMEGRAKHGPIRYWLGKKRSPETVAKIIASRPFLPKPKPPTPEVLAIWLTNMRSANEKRKRPIRCVTDGTIHESIRHAARAYKVSRSQLRRCLNDPAKRAGGLQFEFA